MSALSTATDPATGLPALESSTITFDWPLAGIKAIFDEPDAGIKSKAVQSVPFGDERWTILFYTHRPGVEKNKLSIYINAEPQEDEWLHPLIMNASSSKPYSSKVRPSASGGPPPVNTTTTGHAPPNKLSWVRKGKFHFTIHLFAPLPGKRHQIASKEATDHSFSSQSPNWGWSKFCSHDAVLLSEAVTELDKLIISVSITTESKPPCSHPPPTAVVPRTLLTALGNMLDDPRYSDTVFSFPPRSNRNGPLVRNQDGEMIYAIKQLLITRSEYFKNLLAGGFLEAGEEGDGLEEQDIQENPNWPTCLSKRSDIDENGRSTRTSPGGVVDLLADDIGDDENLVSQDELEDADVLVPDTCAALTPAARVKAPSAAPLSMPDASTLSDSPNDEYAYSYLAEQDAFPDSDAEYEFDDDWIDPDLLPISTNSSYPAPAASAGNMSPPMEDREVDHDEGDKAGAPSNSLDPNSRAALHGQSTPTSELRQGQGENLTALQSSPPRTCPLDLGARQQQCMMKKRCSSWSPTGESDTKRKVIIIPDVCPRTYRALLHYLYTDQVEFAPLTSSYIHWTEEALYALLPEKRALSRSVTRSSGLRGQGAFVPKSVRARVNGLRMLYAAYEERKTSVSRYLAQNPGRLDPCSAKSLFRLADQLNLPDLRARAKAHIIKNLTVDNVPWELFSHFTSCFPDLKEAQLEFFLAHWTQVKSTLVMKTVFAALPLHPGLAQTFPLILEQLEYRGSEAQDTDAPTRSAVLGPGDSQV